MQRLRSQQIRRLRRPKPLPYHGTSWKAASGREASMMDTMSGNETSQMGGTLAAALFLVFLVMALQFNSPKLSLMVMLCIPFSLAGSVGFMFLTTGVITLW
jgi:multidrug efflux pump subunit AcrB